jgi:hypothetical protein
MDQRTRVEKLMAMATQDDSPHERDVARERLATMGHWPPPPKPPAPAAAMGAPEPFEGGPVHGMAYSVEMRGAHINVVWFHNGEPIVMRSTGQAASEAQAAYATSTGTSTTSTAHASMFRGGPFSRRTSHS